MPLKELTFFVSVRVPKGASGPSRSDTLTSARTLPRSILASETPRARKTSRKERTYEAAICGAFAPTPVAGCETISTRGTPARL